ncbi:MAG: small subunit ribosomal protein S4 [Methanobacteriota archaeon]|jgi:small subunit ribosomal protein S4|uniref:Small ribosomal subunit protein uS4 n=1 Tax=Halorutilus salinus TaxID=2487751 RepID=A0A9Q4GFB2_9EURY|nr:30S ribosomal protein S4 [Halorutilus salinus]MCX2817969.1 30S ribosomal protein S4 [Halorutilus salinus]
MGYPGKNVKQYETPNHPFQGERIQDEHSLVDEYGLKNKEELWGAQSELRRYRREARNLLGEPDEAVADETEQLLGRLRRIGVLGEESTLDDVLTLDVTDLLERRLQTVVYRQGLANTIDQARQFVNHGHVAVGRQRVRVPSYTVDRDEGNTVEFYGNSPLAEDLHPERAGEEQA